MVALLIVVVLITVLFTVLLVMVVLVTFLVFSFTMELIRIPTFTTGGAPVTTAGGVPIGAGTMMPKAEPGGGGTKIPSGPIGGGPGTTPGKGWAKVRRRPSPGATKDTFGAAQKPPTKTT